MIQDREFVRTFVKRLEFIEIFFEVFFKIYKLKKPNEILELFEIYNTHESFSKSLTQV